MVEVDDGTRSGGWARAPGRVLGPANAMHAEQVAILRLDNVLLGAIAKDAAYLDKPVRLSHLRDDLIKARVRKQLVDTTGGHKGENCGLSIYEENAITNEGNSAVIIDSRYSITTSTSESSSAGHSNNRSRPIKGTAMVGYRNIQTKKPVEYRVALKGLGTNSKLNYSKLIVA